MISKKILDAINAEAKRNEDVYVDRYRNSGDVNDLWFGGFDLGSKHDYGRDYLSQEQRDSWANLTPEQRDPLLRATFHSAMEDDDRSFGQELVHKGVPLAVGAAMGYGAFTGLQGLGVLGGGGGGGGLGKVAGTLGKGILDGQGNTIPGTEDVGGGGGFWSKLGGMFKNADGSLNWDKIAKVGGLTAGVLGGASYKAPTQGAPVNIQDNTPLQQLTYNRQRNAGPSDYFTYGRGPQAQEHRFFTDANFTENPGGRPVNQPGGTPNAEPMHYAPNDQINQQALLSSLMHKAEGGSAHVRGPGSGREDKIEALLSADEYVMDAETVAMLGDGSPEEGARRLDEMRENIRRHKGKALVKGKFSPNARDPESYLGKSRGGSIKRVITGGLPKPEAVDKKARLEAIRRFESAYRAAKQGREPVRRAAGGKVDTSGAFRNLLRLANQLQHSLQSGNSDKVSTIVGELDSMKKGAGDEGLKAFARGGSVTAVLKKLFAEAPPVERPPRIRNAGSGTLDMEGLARELERLDPNSEVLRNYRSMQNRSTVDLRRRRTDRKE